MATNRGQRAGMTCLKAADVPALIAEGSSARVHVDVAALFAVGEIVRARNINPEAHTRLPRYVRGRAGRIMRDHGVFSFPDTYASGQGPKPQHVYLIRFEAHELWGPGASGGPVFVDLWDDYLELGND